MANEINRQTAQGRLLRRNLLAMALLLAGVPALHAEDALPDQSAPQAQAQARRTKVSEVL